MTQTIPCPPPVEPLDWADEEDITIVDIDPPKEIEKEDDAELNKDE